MDEAAQLAVSVIVPVYNVLPYLRQCLDSLAAQDFTQAYEILLIDDGSTDGSFDILQQYAAKNPDLFRVYQKENGGLSDARNYGIARAKGKYLFFVDSDDLLEHRTLRLLYEKARTTGADVVVCNNWRYRGETGLYSARPLNPALFGRSVRECPEVLLDAQPYAWNKLYRRTLFTENGIEYPKGKIFEDTATTYNLLLMANKVELVEDALYYYRMDRPASITNVFSPHFYDLLSSFESVRTFYDKHDPEGFAFFEKEFGEQFLRIVRSRFGVLAKCADHEAALAYVDALYDFLEKWTPSFRKSYSFSGKRRILDLNRVRLSTRKGAKRYLRKCWSEPVPATLTSGQIVEPYTAPFYKLRDETLKLALRFDAICKENGLTYYLLGGSLLGAMRDGGFIAWDDDLDFSMPRADYERLIEILTQRDLHNLRLYYHTTYPRYHLTFVKLVSTEPSEFTTSRIEVPEKFDKPFLDVFPLDPGLPEPDPKHSHSIRLHRDALMFKTGYIRGRRSKIKKIKPYLLSLAHSTGYLQRKIQSLYRKYDTDPAASHIANFASSYPPDRETFDPKWYGEPRLVAFADTRFPVPCDAEAVLTRVFGDWRHLPPEADRVSGRHTTRWHSK